MSDSQQKVEVILTFDDGPHHVDDNNRTRRVKNKLNAHSARGVFFIQSHALASTSPPDNYLRGKSPVGTKVLKEVLRDGHMVEIHTGYKKVGAHDYNHIKRLNQPTDDPQGYLPGDLERCKKFINSLSDDIDDLDYVAQFVRPVEGRHNADVRARYVDAGLEMVMWNIDTQDWKSGRTPAQIRSQLQTEIPELIDGGTYQIVILFHELKWNTYGGNNLDSYITTIKNTINNHTDDNNTNYVADLNPSKDRIREILREKW